MHILSSPRIRVETLIGMRGIRTYLLSALTNCGLLSGHENAEALRREWAPHLNEFHLFSELSAPSAFRRFSDVRLASDHAPTFVYGIHILKLKQCAAAIPD